MKLPQELISSIETDLSDIETAIAADTAPIWKLTAAQELERIAHAIREAVAEEATRADAA